MARRTIRYNGIKISRPVLNRGAAFRSIGARGHQITQGATTTIEQFNIHEAQSDREETSGGGTPGPGPG